MTEGHHAVLPENEPAQSEQQVSRRVPNWNIVNLRVQQRLFHICKEAKRTAKKARTAAIQKLVKMLRTIKTKSESNDDVPEPVKLARSRESKKLDSQLNALKCSSIDQIAYRCIVEGIEQSQLPDKQHIIGLDPNLSEVLADKKVEWTPADRRVSSSKIMVNAVSGYVSDLHALIYGKRYIKNQAKNKTVLSKEKLDAMNKAKRIRNPNETMNKERQKAIQETATLESERNAIKGNINLENVASNNHDISLESSDFGDEKSFQDDDFDDHMSLDDCIGSDSDKESEKDVQTLRAIANSASSATTKLASVDLQSSSKRPIKLSVPASVPSRRKLTSAQRITDFIPIATAGELKSVFVENLGGSVSDVSLSDDEFEGNEFDDNGNRVKTTRKSNRMGQRARRELWEKQYGSDAKHVKKQIEQDKLSVKHKQGKHANGVAHRSQRNGDSATDRPAASKQKEDLSSLHPSWQAKRKTTIAITEFKGSRITFDDEGSVNTPVSESNKPSVKSHSNQATAKKEKPAAPAEQLHPSWEAKRRAKEMEAKLKASSKPTKIKFDD
ncbi:hypothetical protein BATDEDRAFT_27995 [Batrachochytrium dendrobatidis JAM81]|uniref:Bud22 domain-containing protein n=1 Tax=Batrachochytrium dendrobatidis (strain JAM81 / FGSC 10211) TaxID=684364 RepID=F4PCZ2_BATDJ|nr:uncharacterized protein BATDEDRAFT_27995 [Batrachochytrium dendrobatidis JAM81]EGF76946.1 hypothetical protein BATDEDRAFT_27995 [Batrachochytrium dendrobatidis JAM81]|eukprot:XP_006682384.1 hypothetical protein BATDEDRAFT_27995 [Batrachochytrium dendrobatidis JAM81]